MPLIEWNDAFSIDLKQVDDQHKKLFSLINTLYDAMQQGKGEEVTGTILKELQQYVIYHFNTEESWMKMISYPDLAKHQQEHQEAMQKVNKFIVEYERGSKTISIDLLKFLGDWLQNHILQTDRSYMPYLKGKI